MARGTKLAQQQMDLFAGSTSKSVKPFKIQLLKWVGNKQRFAHEIISYFPHDMRCYYEPFLGSGAVLATLSHDRAIGSDAFEPLIGIFRTLKSDPEALKGWYKERWERFQAAGDRRAEYERVKASYNSSPNSADLVFVSRSCYGGVMRFRKDGYISTPLGAHNPISPESFGRRVDIWYERIAGASFRHADYREPMSEAREGDLVYCDPPYTHSQAILYGGQEFRLSELLKVIEQCKSRGVRVALSIDGTKRSGDFICDLPIPEGLFEREVFVNVGRSMLKRFQMNGESLEEHEVSDRLLLTY